MMSTTYTSNGDSLGLCLVWIGAWQELVYLLQS
jgi:hypothetical protein